ncbi:MAG: T9SS type A sorting domain-containing protein, partial [Flavobacteriales bacterium]
SLSGSSTSTAFTNDLDVNLTTRTAVLAPFWDDLVTTGNPGNGTTGLNQSMKWQLDGTSPNRVLTLEWIGMERFTFPSPNLNFQVKLYETSNNIEFVYGNMTQFDGTANPSSQWLYSCGLNSFSTTTVPVNQRLILQSAKTDVFGSGPQDALDIRPDCYTSILFTAGGTPGAGTPQAAITNDEPGTAISLGEAGISPTFEMCGLYRSAGATASAGITACGAATPGVADDDVWFTFTNPTAQDIAVAVNPMANYDAVVQVFSDAGSTSLNCVNAAGNGLRETVNLPALPVGTYFVRVYSPATGIGTANSGWFHIQAYNPPPVPVNDECAFPTVLTPGTTCSFTSGTTLGATPSADAAPSCGNADDDVWYSFTTNNPDVEITVDGVLGFNAGFQVYSGSCGALVQVGACTNLTGSGAVETLTLTGLTVPATYRIRVFHTASGTGNGVFDICVRNTCAPLTGITAAGGFSPASLTANWTGGNADLFYGVAPLTAPNDLTPPTAINQTSPFVDNTLTFSQNYSLYVRSNCGGGIVGPWQGPFNFNTFPFVPLSGNASLTVCNTTVYDHAGPSASYANNANGTLELTPANAGDVYQIIGTYAVEGCCDNLIIYEGAGTGGPVLFDNGTNASGSLNIASTVPGGTVTIQFTSDVSTVASGFALNVNCIAPPACGSIANLTAVPSGVTAALNWDDVPSAIDYQWQIVPQGNAAGAGVVTSGSSATSDVNVNSGLAATTAYTAWVRSECSGGFGLWFSANFTTGIANDVCSGAIVVGCGASVNGSTTTLNGATNDLMPTQCGAASPDATQTANGVWYRYAGNDQTVTASLCGSGYDSRISIYTGSCGTLTCVAGNDDACGLQSEVSFNAFAGDDYYIMVHGFGGSTGTFTLNITCDELCFTPNDDCATAQPITINTNGTGNPYTQNNECSLLSSFPNATCGGTFSQHTDEWFSFNNGLRDSLHFAILPVAPAPITGSYFAALYSGTCGTPTLIGCVGPVNVGVDGTFWLTGTPANTDYLLRIYRSSSNVATGGDYTIAVSGEALCTGVPAPGATTTTASVVCPGQPFNIAVSNNLPGGISYVYQSGPSAVGPWTTIFTGIQSEIIVPTQSVNTWYRVRANCLTSGQTGIATPVQVAMSPVCYPVPSSPTSPADTEIFSTTVGSGIQGSDCVTAAPGAGSVLGEYSSYLNQPSLTNLVRGGSAGFDIAVNSCGGFFGSKVAIYVDFDQSGTFEAGEEVYEDAASSTGPNNRTGSFNIPVGAPLGQTGMRVILAEVGSFTDITPSLVFTWGEVEDYIVNIVNPAAANDFIGLAQPITSGAFPTCSAAATANLPVASDSPQSNGVGNDVWYSFVATTNAVRIAVTGGAAPHNTQIELRDGVGVIATENDNTANGDETMIVDNLTAGNTYFVGVTQLGGSATATVCISHLRRSTCNNPTTFNSPCTSYKSQFTSANSYTVYFDDDGVSPFVATATSNNGITTIPLSAFTTLPPMTSTQVYQVRVDATYNLPDAAGNITTAVVPGLFNCTRTVNPHAGVFLRDSDASPNVKPANALVAANAWLCGSLFYEWTVQQYDAIGGNAVAPVPTVVNGAPVNRFLNLTGLGLVPNGIYKVNVRPVFASGPGNLGPDRWLIIAGPAPMILDENQAQAFEKNGTEATIESALYPNPSNGSFVNLNITGVEANVMVRVLDGMGRVVWTNNLVVEGSLNTIIAFERPLASGLYTVEMTYDGKVVTERLMVQK